MNGLARHLLALLATALVADPAMAQSARQPGRIAGRIEGISHDGPQAFLSGWACQTGQADPIVIHVYAGGAIVADTLANFESEPAVEAACRDASHGHHRFIVALPVTVTDNTIVRVNGIRIVDGVANDAIEGSGSSPRRLPRLAVPPHPPLPQMRGAYHLLASHPGVFGTPADFADLTARIDRAGSHSGERFAALAEQVARDIGGRTDWDAAYSGCRQKTYLFAFSYEPQERDFLPLMRADMRPRDGSGPPAGAAVVAARAALYAALVKAGASLPANAPSADAATALAKRILLAWADRGFRDADGGYRALPSFDCDDSGAPYDKADAGTGLALGLGRGVVYSVQAQDLLQATGALMPTEIAHLDAFHAAMFELIRTGACRFPGDAAATRSEADARGAASAGPFALDPILFGKWRD